VLVATLKYSKIYKSVVPSFSSFVTSPYSIDVFVLKVKTGKHIKIGGLSAKNCFDS
jgi:hypothetical protein